MLDIQNGSSNKLRGETNNFPMGKYKFPYSTQKLIPVYWTWILKNYILRQIEENILKQLWF